MDGLLEIFNLLQNRQNEIASSQTVQFLEGSIVQGASWNLTCKVSAKIDISYVPIDVELACFTAALM